MHKKIWFRLIFFLVIACCFLVVQEQKVSAAVPAWGDQGNGTYKNPVLHADYSDPDVIRVGDDYYMVSSSFHLMPGIPVLRSKDLMNWTIISHAYPRLENFWDDPNWTWSGYGAGAWAPTIRYHDGKYWIMVGMPKFGSIFITTATDPAGPWSALQTIYTGTYWQDPAPFWDDDGKAYIVSANYGCGKLYIWQVSPDLKTQITSPSQIATGECIEGPKLYKRNGSYIIWAPENGVYDGKQVMLKSNSVLGPYEKRTILENSSDGSAPSGHQGAMVDTQTGESWFLHYQLKGGFGRIMLMQPVSWKTDGWPVVGVDKDGDGIGEPVASSKAPNVGPNPVKLGHQTSDEFSSTTLGKQWQWVFNPIAGQWSLTEKPGHLRLRAQRSERLTFLPGVLTQILLGMNTKGTIKLDAKTLANDQVAGVGFTGEPEGWIGVVNQNGQKKIRMQYVSSTSGRVDGPTVTQDVVYLQARSDQNANATFYYSLDGTNFTQLGTSIPLTFSFWKGMRYALFSMALDNLAVNAPADFDFFHYEHDGPPQNVDSVTPTSGPTTTLTSTPVPTLCQKADINRDNTVDLSDYSILVANFLKTPLSNTRADINGDGTVDLSDYSLLVQNFLKSC